jgi:hypothetical protein
MPSRHTRRQFLGHAGRLGVTAAGLAIAGSAAARPSGILAQEPLPLESVQVLMADVSHEAGDILTARAPGGEPGWRASVVIEAAFAFTHVALHWRGPALAGVEVRTSADGSHWSRWHAVTVEGRPDDNPRGEWFGALVGADRHNVVQYRLPAAGPLPERVTVTYLNGVDGPRRPIAPIPANDPRAKGADLRGEIITREEWGADESLRYTDAGEESWERAYVVPRMVAVHHTATRNFSDDPAADVRAIYAFHTVTRGWGDIGYNALIDAEGRIYEGRRGRDDDPFGRLARDVMSFGVVGAHVSGFNYGSASVSLLGNFMEVEPSEAAWQALEEWLVFQHRRYEIDPRETVDFARSGEVWRFGLPTLCGHRDCASTTECPGDFVYARLPALRARVSERINGGAPTGRVIVQAPGPHNVWPGRLSYRWQGAPPYDRTFEGFAREVGEDAADYRIGYDAEGIAKRVVMRETVASFDITEPGQYTLHVRPSGRAFADRVTVVVGHHVVRDNADTEGVFRSEGWVRSQSNLEYYGSDFEFASSDTGAEFRWELPVPESGHYDVQTSWTSAPDRTRAAPYAIARDGELLATVTADQTLGGAAWASLGGFDFRAGQVCAVTLSAETGEEGRIVVADAVRIVLEA